MVEVMWFVRGAQSAVFYYVACTPCTDVKYRRKRRKEAAQSRAERRVLEEEQPHIIPQPLPFSTNDGWREEIAHGPGPPIKRGHGPRDPIISRMISSKGTGSSGQDSATGALSGETMAGDVGVEPARAGTNTLGPARAEGSRHQREDEELWGESYNVDRRGRNGRRFHKRDGLSVGLPVRRRADTEASDRNYVLRNPVVSELHPAVVTSPSIRRSETIWMLQPPPRAKVMEGKESGSVRSKRGRTSTVDEVDTGAQRSSRVLGVVQKTKSAENDCVRGPAPSGSAEHNFGFKSVPSQRHDREDDYRTWNAHPPSMSMPSKPSLPSLVTDSYFPSFPRRPPLAAVKATSESGSQPKVPRELDAAMESSPRTPSDSTLSSHTLSPSVLKPPPGQSHSEGKFLHGMTGDGCHKDVSHWEANQFKFPRTDSDKSDENEKSRPVDIGPSHERYGSNDNAARFWRWSMDM